MKFLIKTNWSLNKGTDVTMPNLSKDGFKLFFSEYDINNFFIPTGNLYNPHLYWINSIDEIMAHYIKFMKKKKMLKIKLLKQKMLKPKLFKLKMLK